VGELVGRSNGDMLEAYGRVEVCSRPRALMISLRNEFVAWIIEVGGSRYIAGLGFRDCHVDTSLTAIHIRRCDSLSNPLTNRSL